MEDIYHFIGIGGIGMSGLARILLKRNKHVTGSDIVTNQVIEGLIKEGATIHQGQAKEHVPKGAKVVYSSDINKENPEFQAALQLNCPLLHRSDLLAELLEGKKSLAVAGTHGKTTTSALLATVLVEAGLDPTFAVGGVLPAFKSNAIFGNGECFAFEADESDRSFLKYFPFGAIITNINKDHLNNYDNNFQLLIESFRSFMLQVESPSHLFWCKDDPFLSNINLLGQTYGFHPESHWKITEARQVGFNMIFNIKHQKDVYTDIETSLTGQHNILNATAVFGLAKTLGVPETSIRKSLKNFKGVLRRCEKKGESKGVKFIDDYAHHPTEIKTTLQGIRTAIGANRLIAVFQPHRYTRTKDCLGLYGDIFDSVDQLIITDIYAAGETPIPHISHQQILEEVKNQSSLSASYVPRNALSRFLSENVIPLDVVVTLGAGDITKLSSETISLLERYE